MARQLIIFTVCLSLAVFLGYLLATPLAFTSYATVGLVLLGLCLPLLMRWHHELLIVFWNSSFVAFFLPGQPALGAVLAFVSLGFAFFTRTLRKGPEFIVVRSIAWPLLFLALVVLVTAKLTGGIGGRALGSEMWGGKRYLGVLGAIAGYFALSARRIPTSRGDLFVWLFFLSGITALASDLIYAAGPSFYFLFNFVPPELAAAQAVTQGTLYRFTGLTWASMALYFFMIARYGAAGLLDLTKPWRILVVLGLVALSLLGGYRSTLIVLFMIFAVQFYLEGLLRSRTFLVLLLLLVMSGVVLVGFADRLPLSVQRSLSFLPIQVDYMAEHDAHSTLDWRLQMWKTVLPDVPKCLLLGRGYAYSGTDYILTQEAMKRGMFTSYEDTLISGNYHHGLLTIVIPFGIWGLIGFFWFCGSSLRVLYRNYRYSQPEWRLANTFLFAFFSARLFFYLVFYGQLDLDLVTFTGVIGMSVSLNGGVRGPADVEEEAQLGMVPAPASA